MDKKLITDDSKKAKEFFLNKLSFMIGPYELKEKIEENIENINIVDVRKYDDYIDGHIPFAIHVPFENLEEHLVMFEKKKVNIIYCYSAFCKLADYAAFKLAHENDPVQVLHGGFLTWEKAKMDVVRSSSEEE